MDALIVGAGAIGRWVAPHLDGQVAFADIDESAARAAADATDARAVPLDGDETFDVVCIAVPMRVAASTIEEQAHRAEHAMVDFTGSMVDPLETMERVAPDLGRASYHPLFAPEFAPGRVAVSNGKTGPMVDAIDAALEESQNTLVRIDAAEHDDAMKTIQGRAHAAILAFGLAAEEVPEDLSTPVFEDLDALRKRVTDGTSGVYADIQSRFDGASDIAEAAQRIADADHAAFEDLYDDAG